MRHPGVLPAVLPVILLTSAAAPRGAPPSSAAVPPVALHRTAVRDPLDEGPDGAWRQFVDPAQAGFDAAALSGVCARADSLGSGAFMAVWRGKVVVACGAVDRDFRAHSVRKSLVSALYGTAVARGEIDLDDTLGELGIDDDTPLTATEKQATVRDVVSARSGVYLPAAYAPSSQEAERPARGSHAPGTYWSYNNWDFNVAGVIYERATGEDLYASFENRIAEPLGMEDWSREDGFRVYEPSKSRHPAQTFRISARDLARFGQLYLQDGQWNGRQVVPASWVEESTGPISEIGGGTAYGYMWWVYPAGSLNAKSYPELSQRSLYLARGTGGQGLWVIPGEQLVVVHRGDTDHGDGVRGPDAWSLVESVLAARTGEAIAEPRLGPLDPVPLASQKPAPAIPRFHALPDDVVREYLGHYRLSPEAEIRVFLFQGKPYVHVPGEGEALLFPAGEDRFNLRVVSGVEVSFQRDGDGRVSGIVLTLGPQTIRAEKIRE